MLNGLYNSVFGQASNPQGMMNGYGQQQMNNTSAQAWHAQQQMAYNQALMARAQQRAPEWMIAGKVMDFNEFLDTICPEEDNPMRTFLILKYGGKK